MKKVVVLTLGTAMVLSGCQKAVDILVPPPVAAGYADGTKLVTDSGLLFTSTSSSIAFDVNGASTGQQNYVGVYRNTDNPDIIVATINGQDITMNRTGTTWFSPAGVFAGSNSQFTVDAEAISLSSDGQVMLGQFVVSPAAGGANAGMFASGLMTRPSQVSALTGTANYTGPAYMNVSHETGAGLKGGFGDGTANLAANFGTGTVSGTIGIADHGGSDAGFGLSPTTITINPGAISGNGFSSTLGVTPADLYLTSVASTDIQGNFYGVNAADVGATFTGTGVSGDGSSVATFWGGFIGE